jgi:hypothetical protein
MCDATSSCGSHGISRGLAAGERAEGGSPFLSHCLRRCVLCVPIHPRFLSFEFRKLELRAGIGVTA